MKISELQTELANIKDEYGDLEVSVFDYAEEQVTGELVPTPAHLSIDEENKKLTFVDFETAEALIEYDN